MHQALYRKWRPQTFDEVCGQEHITSILKYETEHRKFSHAYLFCGSRGTGKTTCAKILAKAVNCESPMGGSPCNRCAACLAIDAGTATDVLEMDAASNNGVDNIRDIRDEVVYMPSSLKYRVYIVDEVHMLSGSAFNALLKTLEEPPSHVVFILATTELHKLPSTIISRCQRFDFRRISTQVLSDRLAYISDHENIEYEPEALRLISKQALGGMRDAISLLELCAGARQKITPALVEDTIGSGGREELEQTVRAIASANFDAMFATIDSVVRSSKDVSVFWQDLTAFYRDMLVIKTTTAAEKYLDLTPTETERLKKTSELFTKETLLYHCRVLDDTYYMMQRSTATKRMLAEMALMKLCDASLDTSNDALLSRISKLETTVASGVTFRAPIVESNLQEKNNVVQSPVEVVPPTESKNPSPSREDERTFKVLRGWNEIAERAAAGDGASLGFLKKGKALIDNYGTIHLKFPNHFAKSMVDSPQMRESIRASLCMALQKNLDPSELILGIMESNDVFSDLDEFDLSV